MRSRRCWGTESRDGEKATRPWRVILVGDDAGGEVRIESHGDDTGKPAIVDAIAFPPKQAAGARSHKHAIACR